MVKMQAAILRGLGEIVCDEVVLPDYSEGKVLVKMEMTDESWHLIKAQSKVTGFLGGKGKPVAISDAEAKRLIDQISEGIDRPRSSVI